VVLAAGAGRRMGAPKAELRLAGERLVDRAVGVLCGCCDEVLVVARAGLSVDGARVVVNRDPGRGMRSSLELGVAAAADADAVAVLLVDTPGVGAAAAQAVIDAWRPGRIAVGRYAGRRGHPTVMAPSLWREALALAGPDEGARALLATRQELVDEVDVPGSADDLDVPADLDRWRQAAVTLRDSTAEDVRPLAQLYRRAALVSDPGLAVPPLPDEHIRSGGARVAVDRSGTPVGFLTASMSGACLRIDDLFVDPPAMRRGIGSRLLADAVSLAATRHLSRVVALVNPAAVAFYERAGFARGQQVCTEFGTAWRMFRELA
jgi:molybdenum cofactor cytidylyltransferase/nicotine blue oxidoreductase